MLEHVLDLLTCPHDGEALTVVPGSSGIGCPRGHRFDLGRGGYVNLAGPPGPPHSADTAAMVTARERAHAAGLHDAMDAAVVDVVTGLVGDRDDVVLLDVGAGPGHQLAAALSALPGRSRGIAVDAAVPAARRAARCHPSAGAVVADVWAGLPVRSGSVDLLLDLFAPRNPAEFARVLRPDGAVVVATPEPPHLQEVRAALDLIGIGADKRDRMREAFAPDLVPMAERVVEDTLVLSRDAVLDAAVMGPSGARLGPEELGRRAETLPEQGLTVTVAVRLSTLARTAR